MEIEELVNKGGEWFPEAVTAYARKIDLLYFTIYYSSIGIFTVLLLVFLYFYFRYRKTSKNKMAEQIDQNYRLEITWTVIPLILVLILFFWGFVDYIRGYVVPDNAIEYKVLGQKWNWVYTYPDSGATSSELVVPVNQNIKLSFISSDVNHSYFVPNFRLKRDVLPNSYTTIWFNVEKVGRYQVFCTEYCGDGHSTMMSSISVVEQAEYDAHLQELAEANSLPPVELGAKLYQSYGCNACHSLDGSAMIGPTWKGLWGSQRQFTDGSQAIADENYLRTSIVAPGGQIVQGYNNVMPSYAYLTEAELFALIEYIKTLK